MPASDQISMAELHATYSRRCHTVALRVTRDHHLAEDAVQEAFLCHARDPARFDASKASMSTWLITLSRRRAVDLVRREQRRPRPTGDVESVLRERPAADVGSDARAFCELIGGRSSSGRPELSATQRHVLFLTFYLGYTHEQAAIHSGIPVGTVKSRIRAAIAVLAAISEPHRPTDSGRI